MEVVSKALKEKKEDTISVEARVERVKKDLS